VLVPLLGEMAAELVELPVIVTSAWPALQRFMMP